MPPIMPSGAFCSIDGLKAEKRQLENMLAVAERRRQESSEAAKEWQQRLDLVTAVLAENTPHKQLE